jgi:hypothetical protein
VYGLCDCDRIPDDARRSPDLRQITGTVAAERRLLDEETSDGILRIESWLGNSRQGAAP